MGDIRASEADQADEKARTDEWDRLEQEERGQPATDPDPLGLDEADPDPAGNGQADTGTPNAADPARPAAADPDKPDLWANAPSALRAEYDAIQAELERTKGFVKTQEGRVTAETRNRLALEARLAELEKAKPKEPAEEAKPALDDEGIKALRDEYPDVAGPLLDVIAGLEQKVLGLADRDASREDQAAAARQLETQRFLAEQEQQLAEAHPDWRTTCAAPEFAAWVNTQPQFVKDGLARNGEGIVDAAEAAKIVSMFKDETGSKGETTAERRARQMDGGRLPNTRVPSTAKEGGATDRETLWRQMDAEEARQAQRTR